MKKSISSLAGLLLLGTLGACGGGGTAPVRGTQPEGDPTPLPNLVAPECTIDTMDVVLAATPVNTTRDGSQQRARSAALPGGKFVVTWASDDQDGDEYGVYARIFNADGSAVTAEIQVNQHTTDDQDIPSVVALLDGSFVVSWNNGPFSWESKPSPDGDGVSIWARIFNADGTPQTNEFQVNDSTAHDQRHSTLLAMPDGSFVVVYRSGREIQTSPGSFGEDGFIAFKHYAADGTELRAETMIVDSATIGAINLRAEPDQPHAAALDGNRFVVVWDFDRLHAPDPTLVSPPYPQVIQGRIVNVNGTMETTILTVSQHPTDRDTYEWFPRVARAPGGGFTVAWQSQRNLERSVRVRHYDPNGIPRGNERAVVPWDASDARNLDAIAITPIPDYGFLVGAMFRAVGAADEVLLQMIAADGTAAGSPRSLPVDSATIFAESGLDAVQLTNGDIAVTWSGDPSLPSNFRDIFLTIFGCP